MDATAGSYEFVKMNRWKIRTKTGIDTVSLPVFSRQILDLESKSDQLGDRLQTKLSR